MQPTNDDIIRLNLLSATISYPMFDKLDYISDLKVLYDETDKLIDNNNFETAYLTFLTLFELTGLDENPVYDEIISSCLCTALMNLFVMEMYYDLEDYLEQNMEWEE